jgi:lysophospholipase L1-like esterase
VKRGMSALWFGALLRNTRSLLCLIAFLAFGAAWILAQAGGLPKQIERHWIGAWAAAPQRPVKGSVPTFHNQTLRLIVHLSAGGSAIRVRISNIFGEQPVVIGSMHVARRATEATIDPASDRVLKFAGKSSVTVPAGTVAVSDPVDLNVPALSELAISLFLSEVTPATTLHILAQQTNYVSAETGDSTAADFHTAKKIGFWPFLTGVDVTAPPDGATIVAFGSSLTDGDGSTQNANHRWPDLLAERLQKNGDTELGVLNEGIIGNRLLSDSASPGQSGGPPPLGLVFEQLGQALGEAGLKRFERDVLSQPGVRYVILALGVNDILFPGSFIPASQGVIAPILIAANRDLVRRAHERGMRAIGATIPPFEGALFRDPRFENFFSPEKDRVREEFNTWIRHSKEFDGIIDFDAAVRDPNHPARLLPSYDSGDHLHPNDAGNVAQANAISLALFHSR